MDTTDVMSLLLSFHAPLPQLVQDVTRTEVDIFLLFAGGCHLCCCTCLQSPNPFSGWMTSRQKMTHKALVSFGLVCTYVSILYWLVVVTLSVVIISQLIGWEGWMYCTSQVISWLHLPFSSLPLEVGPVKSSWAVCGSAASSPAGSGWNPSRI